MRRIFKSCLFSVAAILQMAGGGQAGATTIIDQQSSKFDGYAQPGDRVGQSFTAGLPGIDFATFSIATLVPSTFRVDVRAGAGFSGALLGSSSLVNLDNWNFSVVEFDFADQIPLTVGSKYTLSVVRVGGGTFFIRQSTANPYAGGNLFASIGSGSPLANFDLVFAEGVKVAPAVPEPAAWAMMVGGFGFVGGAMRRRQRMTVRFA